MQLACIYAAIVLFEASAHSDWYVPCVTVPAVHLKIPLCYRYTNVFLTQLVNIFRVCQVYTRHL